MPAQDAQVPPHMAAGVAGAAAGYGRARRPYRRRGPRSSVVRFGAVGPEVRFGAGLLHAFP
ncbi:hypothetical protein [Streptomyces sp. NPDC019507]|uniref:hypothetical protein n=1 Tax=Streptomyces sp. NPDC019507 TaxID=3154689 RepID=UPI00340DD359